MSVGESRKPPTDKKKQAKWISESLRRKIVRGSEPEACHGQKRAGKEDSRESAPTAEGKIVRGSESEAAHGQKRAGKVDSRESAPTAEGKIVRVRESEACHGKKQAGESGESGRRKIKQVAKHMFCMYNIINGLAIIVLPSIIVVPGITVLPSITSRGSINL